MRKWSFFIENFLLPTCGGSTVCVVSQKSGNHPFPTLPYLTPDEGLSSGYSRFELSWALQELVGSKKSSIIKVLNQEFSIVLTAVYGCSGCHPFLILYSAFTVLTISGLVPCRVYPSPITQNINLSLKPQ